MFQCSKKATPLMVADGGLLKFSVTPDICYIGSPISRNCVEITSREFMILHDLKRLFFSFILFQAQYFLFTFSK
jgi:hypothetical protein